MTSADKKEEITHYTTLTVFPRSVTSLQDKDVPPYIVQGPKDCTALIGGDVLLNVVFGGHPKPEVTWFKGVSNLYIYVNVVQINLYKVNVVWIYVHLWFFFSYILFILFHFSGDL